MEMICINCPMGCLLQVEKENGEIVVKGNQCKKGIDYAIHECTAPTRMVTSSVYVREGKYLVVPVKTSRSIPKDKIFEVLECLKGVSCHAPVYIGDVIIGNVLGLGIDIIATKTIEVMDK